MRDDEPVEVNDREELIYLLTEAAEFEHTVMCSYLYAMWTLEREVSDRVTAAELALVDRWRGQLRHVALEEMLHLSLVNNMLTAIGAAPHLWRPPFPVPRGLFPADVLLRLSPFDEAALDHFVFLERPEGIALVDGAGFDHVDHYRRVTSPDLLSPSPVDYDSQGHLYHGIAQGFRRLAGELGESALFVGHRDAQVGPDDFGLPGLFVVTSVDSAMAAIEEIVTQGEGAPAHSEDSHYARFLGVRDELRAAREARPGFAPARPAATNPVLVGLVPDGATRIEDPDARRLVDLGDSVYTLMLRTFAQVFAPVPLGRDRRADLAAVATDLMYAVTRIAERATRLPVSASQPSVTAGLTLALPPSIGPLVPSAATRILQERTAEIAGAARLLEAVHPGLEVSRRLSDIADRLGTMGDLTPVVAVPVAAPQATPAAPPDPLGDDGDPNTASTPEITIHFDGKRCIHSRFCVLGQPRVFLANVEGAWLHPEAASVAAARRGPSPTGAPMAGPRKRRPRSTPGGSGRTGRTPCTPTSRSTGTGR
jgi:uncharacterized Fe-S cluster protein YjdI